MEGIFNFFGNSQQKQSQDKPSDEFLNILRAVSRMPNDPKVRQTVQKFTSKNVPLDIMNITWEDTGRDAFSCVGPNISDMTLQIQDTYLPVIRHPNFTDFTLDVDSDKIMINVGNEKKNSQQKQVNLTNYLSQFNKFVTNGNHLQKGQCLAKKLMQNERIIVSAQACILPVQKGGESKFNVALYNYQARNNDPAVLAIIATKAGTSAQIIKPGVQMLYFNQFGDKCSFIAERASDFKQTLQKEGKMETDEQKQKAEQLVKVPLKQKEQQHSQLKKMSCSIKLKSNLLNQQKCRRRSRCEDQDEDDAEMEDAVIKLGEKEGVFGELFGLDIERDTRFPVRLTLQFYKASGDGLINSQLMQEIANSIQEVENMGYNFRSLVTGEQIKMEIEEQYIPTCHLGHKMGMFEQNVNVYSQTKGSPTCDLCEKEKLYKTNQYFHCHECSFDLCLNCSYLQQQQWNAKENKQCLGNHNLFQYVRVLPENQNPATLICAQCKIPNLKFSHKFFNCKLCLYNLCGFCYQQNSRPEQIQTCIGCKKNDNLIPIVYGKNSLIMNQAQQKNQTFLWLKTEQHANHPEGFCKRCQIYN